MERWDAGQRRDKGGKGINVNSSFVNAYTCLITKVGRCFVYVYRSLNRVRNSENQIIVKFSTLAGIAEADIYKF